MQNFSKKILFSFLVLVFLTAGISYTVYSPTALAQSREPTGTILPEGNQISQEDCEKQLIELDMKDDPVKEFKNNNALGRETILACAIKTGRIHFWMIPYFIVYVIEFLIGVSGLIAILFIVIGGYQLVISGANESQKDKAKSTIRNAIMGLILVLVAWIIVNVVQYIVTI